MNEEEIVKALRESSHLLVHKAEFDAAADLIESLRAKLAEANEQIAWDNDLVKKLEAQLSEHRKEIERLNELAFPIITLKEYFPDCKTVCVLTDTGKYVVNGVEYNPLVLNKEIEGLREALDNRCDSCACEIANERDKLAAQLSESQRREKAAVEDLKLSNTRKFNNPCEICRKRGEKCAPVDLQDVCRLWEWRGPIEDGKGE